MRWLFRAREERSRLAGKLCKERRGKFSSAKGDQGKLGVRSRHVGISIERLNPASISEIEDEMVIDN